MDNRVPRLSSLAGNGIYITARKDWWSLIFTSLWITGWTFGGIMAMKWLVHPRPSTPIAFISLWLLGWAFGEGWAIYQWFWAAFGKEIIEIREGDLTIKPDILGHGRSRAFPIAGVTNLRASGIFLSSSYWDNYLVQMKLRGGTVAFDSQGRTHRFGIQLTESEAQQVVQELKSYLS